MFKFPERTIPAEGKEETEYVAEKYYAFLRYFTLLRFYAMHGPTYDGMPVQIEAVANKISQHPLSEASPLKVR